MKTKTLFQVLALTLFILLVALTPSQRAKVQSVNWVALQSDSGAITAAGQIITITLDASLNIPITSAALTLRYDPDCLRVISHHPGTLLPGAVSFAQAQAGQFNLAYDLQGRSQGQTGSGSLISIQLEALKRCTSDITVAPETILLGTFDANGMAVNLPNVEYRTLILHLTPGQAPAATKTAIPLVTGPVSQPSQPDNPYLFLLLLILLPVFGATGYVLLRRWSRRAGKISPVFGTLPENKTPGLIHAGRLISISEQGAMLGRYTEIIQRDGCFYLIDKGSRNGTFLNGRPLGEGQYLLHDGDDIQLGLEVSYRFVESTGQAAKSFGLKWLN